MTTSESYTMNSRRYFRVKYPPESCPEMLIGADVFKVQDISERGIRLLNVTDTKVPGWIQGLIRFSDRESFEIEGKTVWEAGQELGVKLIVAPLPQARIMKEQQRLKAREKEF